ncbi:hypothetical protein ACIQVL_48855 [Streptomyces sp. NPDC090499]|uniref:hypothetical protein n=1 Tax=Streptomyces sp. NPDC090499 TaxID=3365965 RepID=UPI00382642EF
MAELASNNDWNPIDPRTLILTVLTCLTIAATMPPDRLQSFTGLLGLVLQIAGRR